MASEREPDARIVGDDVRPLARCGKRWCDLFYGNIQWRPARCASSRPMRETPMSGERLQRAGGGESAQILAIEVEIEHTHIWLPGSNALARRLGQSADHAKPE